MAARINKGFFTKVKVARQLLKDQAESIYKQYMDNILQMQNAGDYAGASKALQWLLEHMPAEDGERIVDPSIDREGGNSNNAPLQPTIQIGIQVGGVKQKTLPAATAEVIDAAK